MEARTRKGVTMSGCFFVSPAVFHWFHFDNEVKERSLETGILTIKGTFRNKDVTVEVKNGLARVMADDGILPRLEAALQA